MGGYNSGGHNHRGRPTVEQCRRLSIKEIKPAGILQPGTKAVWNIADDIHVDLSTYEGQIVLKVTDSRQQPSRVYSKFVGVEKHRRPFGGFQHYFACPDCGRRCTCLFFYSCHFACRRCYRLPYQSQRLRTCFRLQAKARKVEALLSGESLDDCTGLDIPPKPKGMHTTTYERLILAIERANDSLDSDMFHRFSRFI